jgi:hypothetical protein
MKITLKKSWKIDSSAYPNWTLRDPSERIVANAGNVTDLLRIAAKRGVNVNVAAIDCRAIYEGPVTDAAKGRTPRRDGGYSLFEGYDVYPDNVGNWTLRHPSGRRADKFIIGYCGSLRQAMDKALWHFIARTPLEIDLEQFQALVSSTLARIAVRKPGFVGDADVRRGSEGSEVGLMVETL